MGHLGITATVFVVTLLVAHAVMRRAGKNPQLWRKADYVWLGVASLALLSGTAQVRMLIARNALSGDEAYFEARVDELKRHVDFCKDYYPQWVPSQWPDSEEGSAEVRAFQNSAQLFQDLHGVLEDNPIDGWRQVEEKVHIDIAEPQDTRVDKRFVLQKVNEIRQAQEELENQKHKSQPSSLEQVVTAFAPWLLAIALAIRITKVSAQGRGYT